jgi:5-methylcytosine-specific restriction endonuclease McrA
VSKSKGYIDLTTREGRNKFYQSTKWRAMRNIVLTKKPYCVECLKENIFTLATEVDHIVDIKDAPSRCMDHNNLQGLCKGHHSQKTFHENTSFQKQTFTVLNKKWDFSINNKTKV